MDERALDFETLAAQAGLRVRVGDTISTAPVIDPSTTFTAETVHGVHEALAPDGRGFAYARNANPTVVALETALAGLEKAQEVIAFASGMAAIDGALLGLGIESGDSIVAATDLYGVTRSLLTHMAGKDVSTVFVDVLNVGAVERVLQDTKPRALLFETISNPLLRVPNLASLIELAHRFKVPIVIDNTFATPYLLRPLEAGADIVVHSATKYLAGHGDAVVGVVATNGSLGKRIRDMRTVHGGVLSPFEAWLTLRGIRTLPLRVRRQSESAMEIAGWLQGRPWVRRVYYPGLPDHPQHEIASQQFDGLYGGMVAFDLEADREVTLQFIDALSVISPGTTLGDVESLVLYPPLSSHRMLNDEELQAFGIGQGLVRLSVGVESPRDLMADLESAAETASLTVVARAGS